MKKQGMKIYKIHVTMHLNSFFYIYFDRNRTRSFSISWHTTHKEPRLSVSVYDRKMLLQRVMSERIHVTNNVLYIDLEVTLKDGTISIVVTDMISGVTGAMQPQEFSEFDFEISGCELTYMHLCDIESYEKTKALARRPKVGKKKEGVTC